MFCTPTIDYRSVLCDIFNSEAMKIDSSYTEKLKKTVQWICEDGDKKFEKCFERVRKEIEEVVTALEESKKEQQGYVFVHCWKAT